MANDVNVTNWPSANAKEQVALDLMKIVMNAERQYVEGLAHSDPDRKYLLDLYAECLKATGGYTNRKL